MAHVRARPGSAADLLHDQHRHARRHRRPRPPRRPTSTHSRSRSAAPSDLERVRAVRAEAPGALVRVDANEAWTVEFTKQICPELVALNVELIEQPLHADNVDGYRELHAAGLPIPIVLDESVHTLPDVGRAAGLADGVNIKLTKSGGIREAHRMIHAARSLDLMVMLGCMNETSLGISAAVQLSPLVDVVDLDGHLLNANDAFEGLGFENGGRASQRPARPRSDAAGAVAVTAIAILAEGGFSEHDAKTATGVLRYGADNVVAVIDSTRAGSRVRDHIPGLDSDVPVVESIDQALALRPAELLIGIAPAGGKLPDAWRVAILRAIEAGLDVVSGLHDFLGDDPELAAAATQRGVAIRDLRRPPAGLDVPTGANLTVDAHVVATVGSDCALGKMTVCLELDLEARRRGLASGFVPTGQTGIAIAGWGIAVDEVVSDFVAGASERLVVEGSERSGPGAILWIEGQGSVNHPAYSGVTLGLLHGSAPHVMILVHEAGRTHLDMPNGPAIPPLSQLIEDYQRMAGYVRPANVIAVSLKTNRLDDAAARAAIAEAEAATGLPADDPVRYGAGKLLDAVEASR